MRQWLVSLGFIAAMVAGGVQAADAPKVRIVTSLGAMEAELNADKAPKTVQNFLTYADTGFYKGTIFHRVIPGFMIQGGGFDARLDQKKTRAAIENEADNGLKNKRGTLAMARTTFPDSATAQFFINLSDNDFLDHRAKTQAGWGYAVFGKIIKGMDVADKIAKVQTMRRGPHEAVPITPVVIKTVERID